jgi:hypothetical protein
VLERIEIEEENKIEFKVKKAVWGTPCQKYCLFSSQKAPQKLALPI